MKNINFNKGEEKMKIINFNKGEEKMKISKDTKTYNDRRYGKPWIAKIDFNDPKGSYNWGEWCGQAGTEGTLYVECEIGDIIAIGQKDFRKPANSVPDYYIVKSETELEPCSKADAYKHYQSNKNEAPTDPFKKFTNEQILAEAKKRKLI